MTSEILAVPDIHCQHCKASIEGAVANLDGVESVAVDIDGAAVQVAYDAARVPRSSIIEAIEDQGYEVA